MARSSLTPRASEPAPDLEGPITGTVTMIKADRGFAFVEDHAHRQYFLHRTACTPGLFEGLQVGDGISFKWASTLKGLRAYDVERD
jgi:cold shock CspA family protein